MEIYEEEKDPTDEEITRFVNSFKETFYKEHPEYDSNIPLSEQSQKIRDQVWQKTAAWLG